MFELNTSISGQTGNVGVIQIGSDITFADIFSGLPQYYHGSSVEVQERMRIILSVDNPQLIDKDFNWWSPKQYLGTWQVIDTIGLTTWIEGRYGYLNGVVQDIDFKSRYTIVANPNTPVALGDQIDLSSCNFYLKPDVYVFPGNPIPVPGQRLHKPQSVLLGAQTYQAAPLEDTPYNQFIGGMGLHLLPGVSGVSLNYSITVVNDINTDYDPYLPPTCDFGAPTCQQLFAAFILSNNNRFSSQASCLAVRVECYQYTWTCPINPSVTFPYWLGVNV